MASGKRKKHARDEPASDFLVMSISQYVLQSKLSSFADELEVPKPEKERIMAPEHFPTRRTCKRVSVHSIVSLNHISKKNGEMEPVDLLKINGIEIVKYTFKV